MAAHPSPPLCWEPLGGRQGRCPSPIPFLHTPQASTESPPWGHKWLQQASCPLSPGFPAAVPPLPREGLGQDENGAADEEAGRGGGGWPAGMGGWPLPVLGWLMCWGPSCAVLTDPALQLLKKMSSSDTPLGTVALLQEKQKAQKTPYIVLSGSGKSMNA